MTSKRDFQLICLHEFKLGHSAADATRNINAAWGKSCVAESTIRRWFTNFRSGNCNLEGKEGRGRNVAVDNDQLRLLVESNPQTTVRDLSVQLQVSISTISVHLDAINKVKKLNRWIPHLLTEQQKMKRFEICSMLLLRNKHEPFLNRIITCDEKWICYDNRKRSSEWVDRDSPPRPFPKPNLHPKKIMVTVWWSRGGLIHYEFLKRGETITSTSYCTQIEIMHKKLAVKCPSLVNRKTPILLHDNARPHVAHKTLEKLNELRYEMLPHPPYSPDLSPTDYHFFRALQHFLSGKQFKNDVSTKQAFEKFIASRTTEFYETGISKLVSRWEQCIQSNGNYFV